MADLTMTPVATQIQPQRPMTLGEMLNLASGVQQYQQAQQMMPLQLEAQRLAVEQAGAVNPLLLRQQQVATRVAEATADPRIAQQVAQTETAQTQARQAAFALDTQHTAVANNILGALAVDPRIVNPQNPGDPVKALMEGLGALRRAGVPEEKALMNAAPLLTMAAADPKQLPVMIQNLVRQGVGTAGQLPLQTPAITTQFGGQPAVVAPGALGTTQVQPLPMPGAAPAPAGATAAPAPAAAPSGVVLRYPVRQPGVPFAEGPSEAADRDAGTKYRVGLQQTQTQLPLMRRNVEEVLAKAGSLAGTAFMETGKMADLERGLRQFFGDTRYKELSKDLANIQIAMMQAQGGSMQTDAGKQLMAASTGDVTYPPSVLMSIVKRIGADVTKMDLEAQAAERFSQRFGDNNLTSFRTTWQSNADTRIFQAMNIMRDIKGPTERAKEIDKLFGTNPADRKRYFEQYQRIKRMVETGAPE